MGKYDESMYAYMDDGNRFADFFNGVLFQGEQVICADMLESSSERYITKENKEGKTRTASRFRDLKKRLKNGDWLALMAVENQESVDAIMPLRMMEYDCLEYTKQAKNVNRKFKNRFEGSDEDVSHKAGQSGKEQKLHPVYSICLYHGTEDLKGPRSLRDMMDFENAPPGWEDLFHDYGMTLFCVNQVEDFSVFKTELRQLLEVIPCRKDKRKLKELFDREEYKHLDRDTAEVIAVFTDNSKMIKMLEEKAEDYNMCQALDDLVADGRAEGKIEGKAEGREETLLDNLRKIMRNMACAAEQAMNLLEVPMEERAGYLAKLQ